MILMDFSGIVISSATEYHNKTKEQIDIKLLRHISLNSLLAVKDKLSKYADETVLAIDGKNYWRKEVFPLYKQNRKLAQVKDTMDWDLFHESFNQLKAEFKDNLPYKYVEVEGAEADDIMAVLGELYGPHRKVVIASSDHDMAQVQKNICPQVVQYSPYHKKFVDCDSYNFFEHVVKGDAGDGIPNIFSDDDTHVTPGKRQKPVKTADLKKWELTGLSKPEVFCETTEVLARLERNRKIIDLSMIPEELKKQIVVAYNDASDNKGKLFNYLVTNRLKKIMERGNF